MASDEMDEELNIDQERCKHCGRVFEPEDEVRTTRDICDDCLEDYTPISDYIQMDQ